MAKIKLHAISWLSRAFGAEDASHFDTEMEVKVGETVRALFDSLAAQSHDFAEYIFDRDRQDLTGRVVVVFNDRILELVDGLDTKIQDGDTILLVPAYAGG
ncbi:MAG: MoaD/ThiS family protein [Chloroflexota bacterium]